MPITRDYAVSVVKRAGGDGVGALLRLLDKSPTLVDELEASSSLSPEDADEIIITYLHSAEAEGSKKHGKGSAFAAHKQADNCHQRFWQGLGNVELGEDKCLKLPEGAYWFGDENLGSVVFVRACYDKFWTAIKEQCISRKGVAVTGSPGIGKTLGLGGYILWKARTERFPVLYHRTTESVFLYTFHETGAAVVYEAATEFDLKDGMTGKGGFYICDGAKPYGSPGAPTILITSPEPEIMKTFCLLHQKLYMDIWSLEELAVLKKHYEDMPDTLYNMLLTWYGPVPRMCLEQWKVKKGRPDDAYLEDAHNAIKRRDLVAALCCDQSPAADDRKISHLLVHLRPSEEDMRDVVYKIATPKLASEMIKAALKEGEATFSNVMCGMTGVTSWSKCSHVYGTLYEFYVLSKFVNGGKFDYKHVPGQQCVELPEFDYKKMDEGKYKFIISEHEPFQFSDLSKVSTYKTATLYSQNPWEGKSLAAADAILTPTGTGKPAFLIQVTAGKKKTPLSEQGVKAVQDFLMRGDGVWGESVQLVIVYVVPPHTYDDFTAERTEDPAAPGQYLPRMILKFPVGMENPCDAWTSSPGTSPSKKRKLLDECSLEELRAEVARKEAAGAESAS